MSSLTEPDSLPRRWATLPLEKVITKLVDGSHNPPSKQESGVPMLSARNILNNQIVFEEYRLISEEDFEREHTRTRISPGDVLLTMVGTIGRSAVVPAGAKRFALQRSVAVITPTGVLPKYLMYQFQAPSLQRHFEKNARGTAQKGVYLKTLGQTPMMVAPLGQQKLIVAEIEKQFSRLDEAVANLKRVKANLKRYKAAVLKAAVEGKLTEDWRKQHPNVEPASKLLEHILAERRAKWNGRGKYKEPAPPDTNDLPSRPKGWTWTTVEQLAAGYAGAIQSGPFGSQLLHSEFVDDGILAIGIDNVLDGKFSLGRKHRVTPAKFEILKKFEAHPRDVVITVMATVGRVCVLPHSLEQAIITKHCYRIAPVSGNVDPDFLAFALRADSSTRQYIFGNVRGQTRPGINGAILKASPVSLPPFAEQKEIVAEVERRLSVIEELEAAVEANLIRAECMRQSILSQAFSGKLIGPNPTTVSGIGTDIQMARSIE